ncbi:hypothetical protein [Roseovarius indicus]|uniref:hypothetical protein n=1 Tax=Roseovarius indicus TaxID=540747 RepID=UPI0032EED4DD
MLLSLARVSVRAATVTGISADKTMLPAGIRFSVALSSVKRKGRLEEEMATKGLYRVVNEGSGAEYAIVEYELSSIVEGMPRQKYEELGIEPAYEDLPTQEEFDNGPDGQA